MPAFSQTQFSIATDVSFLRSLKKDQRFWAVGQTVQGHFHFSEKEGVYIMFSYYTPGKFKNDLVATARDSSTIPRKIRFSSDAVMRFRHFTVGWKHYFKGRYNMDSNWSLYGFTGFGLLIGTAQNTYAGNIDTSLYISPVSDIGTGGFKRLTLDLAAGWEIPIGVDIFVYAEGRLLIPTTEYPSKYLLANNNAPFAATANAGIRILFD